MKTTTRVISPKVAKEMLKRNVQNRKVSDAHVKFLSSQMKAGSWVFDGQPIRFDKYDRLLDGQHRLNAVIDSGESINFLIVSGLPSETFKVMDTGKNRNGADVFSIIGESYASDIAAVARTVIQHDRGVHSRNSSNNKISNTDLVNWYKKNKKITKFIKDAEVLRNDFNRVMARSQIAALSYIFSKISVTHSEEFISKLCTGLGLKRDSPIFVLRKKLIQDKVDKATLPTAEKTALIFKAWNLYRKGETCKFLRWNKANEKFPELI